MALRNIPLASAGPQVRDVMLREPGTVDPATTVGEARALFENPRVRQVLIAKDGAFLGAVTRASIPGSAHDEEPLGGLPLTEVGVLAPTDPVARAVELLDARATERIPVVADGALVGLVCFNRRHGHFCVDA